MPVKGIDWTAVPSESDKERRVGERVDVRDGDAEGEDEEGALVGDKVMWIAESGPRLGL